MIDGDRDARIRGWAVQRRLPAALLARWLALPIAAGDALLAVAENLRLRAGQFVSIFELLDEICVREGGDFAGILARRDLRRVIDDGGSAPDRASALLASLRAIRFPRLQAASARIAAQVAELKLPAGVRLVLPKNLGSDELRLEMTAHNSAELEHLLEALTARRTALCRIADALGGADEL